MGCNEGDGCRFSDLIYPYFGACENRVLYSIGCTTLQTHTVTAPAVVCELSKDLHHVNLEEAQRNGAHSQTGPEIRLKRFLNASNQVSRHPPQFAEPILTCQPRCIRLRNKTHKFREHSPERATYQEIPGFHGRKTNRDGVCRISGNRKQKQGRRETVASGLEIFNWWRYPVNFKYIDQGRHSRI